MLKKYLENITKIQSHNDHREESFYPAVAELITDFAMAFSKSDTSVTILPKKTEAGNPDFRVWNGNDKIVGYIEAKIPETDLSKVENTPQLQRYLETFPNVILTDFFEFRLYRNGKLIDKVSIARPFIATKLNTVPYIENQIEFERLLNNFFDFSLPKIYNSESLALELAKRTRFLRDEIVSIELKNEDKKNYIRGFYNAFNKYLISGLQETEFADLYSQTITYGLFAAKTRAKQDAIFNRRNAVNYIPPTIGILRDVFEYISLGQLPHQMEVIIDDIAEVLSVSDATKLLNDYYKQGKGSDPIIHFYETFLNKYDPNTREKRGVYYTPEPVVKYIVNSVDEILKNDFGKIGFADSSIKVLDPAGGTLTFLAEATKKAINTFVEFYGDGDKNGFIKRHILKNFYGFELMMSPYAIAHLKMSYLLQEEGYTFDNDDRFQLYLTNTLDAKNVDMPQLPGLSSLAEEAEQANIIKKEKPILAIIGNPPYSFDSYNKSEFETEIMKLYKEDVKNERNIKILSDDYIKFIRYCHWKIEQSGSGVIGLITKNTYLNIGAAKGLRKQLLKTFDKIYILNLHGKLYEKSPNGEKDQNVFDIRVGTAIMILVKYPTESKTEYAELFYRDLYGVRDIKYSFLTSNNIISTFSDNDKLDIDTKHFFFEKKEYNNKSIYDTFWTINEIFIEFAMGVSTHRDHFIIDENPTKLENRLKSFIILNRNQVKDIFSLENNSDFNIDFAKSKFKEFDINKLLSYSFKAFWNKSIYYDKLFIDRDRYSIMQHFINKSNIGLITVRRQANQIFNFAFVTNKITDFNFLGVGSYTIPLWVFKNCGDAFNGNGKYKNKVSNINPKLEDNLKTIYSKDNITEDIFYYIYAVLYSNAYRNEFSELLKIDYPKIPFTKDVQIFEAISEIGKKLSDLHLMKSINTIKPKVKYFGSGDGKVVKPEFVEAKNIVKINDSQYFDNISKDVWEFSIGKNQILKQWLNRRETIEFEDAIEFCQIATAIYETFELQTEIDNIYPDIFNNLMERLNY